MTRHPTGPPAFTFAEMLIAMAGSIIILGALLLSSTQLQRALYASERYAARQTDQRRLIDYLGRDLRRAIGCSATANINGSEGTRLASATVRVENGTSLAVTLPGYYQSETLDDDTYDEALPPVVADNYVDYGTEVGHAPSVRVIFRKEYVETEHCVCFVRVEAGNPIVIVREADDLHLEVTASPDGRTCTLALTYSPPGRGFSSRVSTHYEVLMRNIRTD